MKQIFAFWGNFVLWRLIVWYPNIHQHFSTLLNSSLFGKRGPYLRIFGLDLMPLAQAESVCSDSAAVPPYMDQMLGVGSDLTILAVIHTRLGFLTFGSMSAPRSSCCKCQKIEPIRLKVGIRVKWDHRSSVCGRTGSLLTCFQDNNHKCFMEILFVMLHLWEI